MPFALVLIAFKAHAAPLTFYTYSIDSTEFDSSYARNAPETFPLSSVVPCWTEGIQKMKVGGKAVLVCPSNLAYGDQGRPSIPGGAALIFEVELLDIVPGAAQ